MKFQKEILIIDDDDQVRETFIAALERDYQVTGASNGLAGLDSVRRRPPQLIFLDLKMAGMSGVETLAALHDLCPGVSVYIVTAFYGEFLTPLKTLQDRGVAFDPARKPLTLAEIRAIADGVLHHRVDTSAPHAP